jgi:hypothetical protein
MDRINMTPAEILRDELNIKTRTLPVFLRPQLGPVLGMLDMWVASVEARVAALQKMPSAEVLAVLVQDAADAGVGNGALDIEAKRIAKMHARVNCTECEGCEDG